MESWDEVRTAFHVARAGTVSGAAEALGVHHATVIRHIDALEGRLGVKLFQRHARGYTPTEAGRDLLDVAQAADDRFNQLAGRIKGQGADVTGDLVVTSLLGLSAQITPLLAEFQKAHDGLRVVYLTGDRLFRLEYGEAHVAIRAGVAPDQPDNVVQKFTDLPIGAYASTDYVDRFGKPSGPEEYASHRFIGPNGSESRAPYAVWLAGAVPEEAVVFRCSDNYAAAEALRAGVGIGFLPALEAAKQDGLIEIEGPRADWAVPLWLVTHVDLHRTSKVQALLTHLKDSVKANPL